MTTEGIFKVVCGMVTSIMLIYYMRRKRKVLSAIFGAVTGIAALSLVNKFGGLLDIDVPLNLFNVGGSVVLGIPFVVCLVVLSQI